MLDLLDVLCVLDKLEDWGEGTSKCWYRTATRGEREEGKEEGHSYKFGGCHHKGGMEINGCFRDLWSCSALFILDLTTIEGGCNI